MMRQRLIRRGVTLAVAAALVAAPSAAFAQSDEAPVRDVTTTDERPAHRPDRPDSLEEAKRRALEAIKHRLGAIERLASAIGSSRHVTEDHATTLRRDLADAAQGLEALAREIAAAETPEGLRPLVESIVTDFRIFVLVAPKVHEVLASDALVWVADKLGAFADKLGEIIARADDAGLDVEEPKRLLNEMRDFIAEGARTAEPVAGSVIGLQPGDWPDPAEALLRAGRDDLHSAAGSMRGAHGVGTDIVKVLRELIGGHDRTDAATDTVTG